MPGLPQLTPKLETMGVRSLFPHSLPLGFAHFLPAGCLRKCPCPGTVWPGLCFPRGPTLEAFKASVPCGASMVVQGHHPPLPCLGFPGPQGQIPGYVPISPRPPILHTSVKKEPLGIREVDQ